MKGWATPPFSAGGLLWGPNKLSNARSWAEAIAVKYGILSATAHVANKVDVVTISTLNIQATSGLTVKTIGSSAGAGMTIGLKALGKLSTLGMAYATAADIIAHGTCAIVASPDPIATGTTALSFP